MNRVVGHKLKVAIIAIGIISLAVAAYLVYGKDSRDRLIRAVAEGDIKTVRGLLKEDETLAQTQLHHRKAATYEPVIQIAVRRGHQDVAKLLLSCDIDARQISPALRLAQSRPLAELLIEHGANVNWRRQEDGSTALHFFAAVDNVQMMELLIDNGAIVNVTDGSGQIPLHKAAREGRLNAAKLLVSNGADISVKSEEGKTPFDYAVIPVWNEDAYRLRQRRIDRCKEVAAYLLSCGSSATVFDLAWLGDMERLRVIIKSNPSLVNERAHGEPLVFAAIRGGSAEVVEYLLTHGAKLRVTSRHQQSPLRLAAYLGHTDVARILLDHGVGVDEKGQSGETPLHYAVACRYHDIAEILLKSGADPKAKMHEGMTAVEIARKVKDRQLVALLTLR